MASLGNDRESVQRPQFASAIKNCFFLNIPLNLVTKHTFKCFAELGIKCNTCVIHCVYALQALKRVKWEIIYPNYCDVRGAAGSKEAKIL